MFIKNVSKAPFNLASGVCAPGETGEADSAELRLLISQDLAEAVIDDQEEDDEPAEPVKVVKAAPVKKAAVVKGK